MSWIRRGAAPAGAQQHTDQVDDAGAKLAGLRRLVNRNAGLLPVRSVVAAHEVIDALAAALEPTEERDLDVRGLVGIERVVDDYLPTTIQNFLALRANGAAAAEALQEQLDLLLDAADGQLAVLRERRQDAMGVHQSFLRTKFSQSDLDIS